MIVPQSYFLNIPEKLTFLALQRLCDLALPRRWMNCLKRWLRVKGGKAGMENKAFLQNVKYECKICLQTTIICEIATAIPQVLLTALLLLYCKSSLIGICTVGNAQIHLWFGLMVWPFRSSASYVFFHCCCFGSKIITCYKDSCWSK